MNILATGELYFHIDKAEDFAGFVPINVEKGHYFWLLTRASITSDEPLFYKYIEQISNYFFSRAKVLQNAVYQFLVLIHKDLSADLYINNFTVMIEIMAKSNLET